MRESFLPFHRPSISEVDIEHVVEALRSGWITTGPKTKQFESDFSNFIGTPHALALNSATAALHLALAALGLQAGDEVMLPTNTFTATAEVVTYFGALPILVDCHRDTFNLNEKALEERVTSKTRAVIPVHMAGQSCDMSAIMNFAKDFGLYVIEDAAHALPATWSGQTVGTFGDVAAFSFYATKTITTGEGGMATTANLELDAKMRMLSLHGISHDAWNRYAKEGSWYYEVRAAGFKYNMTDIAAALGMSQLQRAIQFRDRRAEIASLYTAAFKNIAQVRIPEVSSEAGHAWHLYILVLDLDSLSISRTKFSEELKARNIGSSVHFIPLHLQPYYKSAFGYQKGDFPDSEWIYERCISLPIFPDMSDDDVADVIDAVQDVANANRR